MKTDCIIISFSFTKLWALVEAVRNVTRYNLRALKPFEAQAFYRCRRKIIETARVATEVTINRAAPPFVPMTIRKSDCRAGAEHGEPG